MHADSNRQSLLNLDDAFVALRNREWHYQFFADLQRDFEAIAKPVNEGKGVNGEKWMQAATQWRGLLDRWLVIADYYATNTADTVRKIHDYLYDGEWTFDEKAMTANQVHRYKEVAILWHNAREAKPRVDQCFELAIFHAPSKKGRGDRPPIDEPR